MTLLRPAFPDALHLVHARAHLVACDPALAALDAVTPPFAWREREEGIAGLIWLIAGQQVSTASAAAIWARLSARIGTVTPEAVAALGAEGLRACGFSGPKVRYVLALAEAGFSGVGLEVLEHEDAISALTALKGVGRWTAESYLMMSGGRLDAWPAGDIALQEVIRWIDRLPDRPDEAATIARAEVWRPYRAVAAHLLWAYYVAVKAGEIRPL